MLEGKFDGLRVILNDREIMQCVRLLQILELRASFERRKTAEMDIFSYWSCLMSSINEISMSKGWIRGLKLAFKKSFKSHYR